MPNQLTLLTSMDQLLNCRQAWNSLAGDHPFLNWEWMVSWWETYSENHKLRILVAKDSDNQWHGIAPFFIERKKFGASHLRLISSGKACADYSGIYADPQNRDWFVQQVTKWLSGEHRELKFEDRVDLIDFEGITKDTHTMGLLNSELIARGYKPHLVPMENCWEASLSHTWQVFNAKLSKSFRRKSKKAVQRLSDPKTQVRIIQSETGFEDAWADFVDLHQRRRAMLGQPGCFAEEPFEQFLKKATWRLFERKAAALIMIDVDDTPFAAGLLLLNHSHAYMYQSGVDSNRIAMEPGHALNTAMIQFAIDSGKTHFDFLRGDEPYKSRWNTTAKPLFRARYVPNKLGSQLRHRFWLTARSIKNWASTRTPTPDNS